MDDGGQKDQEPHELSEGAMISHDCPGLAAGSNSPCLICGSSPGIAVTGAALPDLEEMTAAPMNQTQPIPLEVLAPLPSCDSHVRLVDEETLRRWVDHVGHVLGNQGWESIRANGILRKAGELAGLQPAPLHGPGRPPIVPPLVALCTFPLYAGDCPALIGPSSTADSAFGQAEDPVGLLRGEAIYAPAVQTWGGPAVFGALADLLPRPAAILGGSGQIEHLNRAFLEILGFGLEKAPTLESLAGLSEPDDLNQGDLLEGWRSALERARAQGSSVSAAQISLGAGSGGRRTFEIDIIPLDHRSLLCFNEVSELRTARVALSQERELKAILSKIEQQWIRSEDPTLLPRLMACSLAEWMKPSLGAMAVLWEPASRRFLVGSSMHGSTFKLGPKELSEYDRGATRWMMENRRTLTIGDCGRKGLILRLPGSERAAAAFVGLPLLWESQSYGAIYSAEDRPRRYDHELLSGLTSLASDLAGLIEKVRRVESIRQVAVEQERQRLSQDLHDTVSQSLFSASLIAETLPTLWERDPAGVIPKLEYLYRLTSRAAGELRALLTRRHQSSERVEGLEEVLEELCAEVLSQHRVQFDFNADGQSKLPATVHENVMRIAREALHNIVKHARAKHVSVNLNSQPERFELRLSDDGMGFDPLGVNPGCFGLKIMRERSRAIGAILRIKSQAGQGSEVLLVWPGPERRGTG